MLVSPTINSLHGRIRSITGTDPAVNTEISETVPARRRWKLHTIRFSLLTDVNAADRRVKILIDDGTNALIEYALTNIQTASLTYYYSFAPIPCTELKIGTVIFAPFPHLILGPSYRIKTVTANKQVGDNYSAPQMLVEEWIDP